MRRTYKSKKDADGALDRRDLLLNLDEKSLAYNAFFIHNIKQTKRELSCIGSSNTHGVASNRVRKRKYVKRIVKEAESPLRESLSRSAYLTPDKSIRVNKPLDPFDMLLNSSPACLVQDETPRTETVTSKVNLFNRLVEKKEGRTYTRRKPVKAKHYNNYSGSDKSDSDKENSSENINETQNTSDIKSYKLLIENEANITPRRFNDSINKIVNNLSLINRLKLKNSFNESMKRPLSYNRNRLTRNIQSPILQKSPLCSTPFKVKYRGESIFRFSPISNINYDSSPKETTINEDNDNSNNSIVFLVNDDKHSPRSTKENQCNVSSLNIVPNDSIKFDVQDEVHNTIPKEDFYKETFMEKLDSKLASHSNALSNIEISSVQTTELEPLLGFSNEPSDKNITEEIHSISHLDKIPNDSIKFDVENEVHNTDPKEDFYKETFMEKLDPKLASNSNALSNIEISSVQTIEIKPLLGYSNEVNNKSITAKIHCISSLDNISINDIEEMQVNDADENSQSIKENNECDMNSDNCLKDDNNSSSESLNSDNNTLYDTCSSEQSFVEDREVVKEPMVQIQRMNDSLFMKYYEKMHHFTSEGSEMDGYNDSLKDKLDLECSVSFKDDVTEEYNENLLDEETSENSFNSDVEVFSQEDEFASIEDSNEISDNSLNIEVGVDNNLLVDEADDLSYDISSNDDNGESNDEEKCISFVTTRRRNEITNNSMMSMFNESYASSSTDCDKTVLSKNIVPKKSDMKETLMDLNTNAQLSGDEVLRVSKDGEHKIMPSCSPSNCPEHSKIPFITRKHSNVTDRKSSIRNRKSSIQTRRNTIASRKSSKLPRDSPEPSRKTCFEKPVIVLQPGKKWERSLSIYRRMTMMTDHCEQSVLDNETPENKGRKYRQSIINTLQMQEFNGSLHNDSINSRRSTFVSKPSRSTIRIVKDPDISRLSLSNTTVFDDLKGFLNEECDDTIIEISKLSITDQTHEVTVLNTFHDTSNRLATARDYVLRRCSQTDAILFDECYPDAALKNCHKIGEGVYGEVFLWRDRDGRARVLKIVPIAGTLKVNGESQKDFHEIISEIVIAMELSALRAPIAEINRQFDDGKAVEALDLHAIENATDIFNEVLAVRCVYGSYPARLLDLWDLYDECKGSENDNPAILPADQQFIVLELANAGQDLESYQFNNAEQAYALFLQVAYGLAVAEEAFQFEHRDLHWGNVLIAPTEQKYSTFVLRGRSHRVARCGVAATIIDYSLSRVSLPLAGGDCAALYNDLATDDSLFDAVGDYQFEVYRLMRDKLGNDWKNFAPYTNILWLHYTVDKMITALRYKRTNTKIHKHYIDKLKGIKSRILDYGSAALFVLTDNEI